jgi:hypothetical protein
MASHWSQLKGNALAFPICAARLGPFSPGGRRSGRGGSGKKAPLAPFHPLPRPLPSRERGEKGLHAA